MKRLIEVLLFAVALCALNVVLRPSLRADGPTPVSLAVTLPDGSMKWVCLQGLTLDLSGPSPILRLPPSQSRARHVQSGVLTDSTSSITLNETDVADLDLTWNGLTLTEGVDYLLTGNTIQMITPMKAGDVYRAAYFVP